ncbi:MAG: methyltransferase domain-containing protein [Lagierella massiliensis]|nr:methyltransferase domain-containing protein [Lagierella massiliensis]
MDKDLKNKKLDESEIRKSVRDFYTDIATGKKKARVNTNELNKALGYSKEQLENVPDEANMGLGCGNPHEKAKPKEGEIVLDLGCGKGFDVFIAAKAVGNSGYVIGVDSSIDMVEKARLIGRKRKFSNVNFRLGEIEYLPVPDNSVDIVISNCVINLSTQKEQVYREILRVLKPGGRIGISDITQSKPLPQSVLDNPKMYGT